MFQSDADDISDQIGLLINQNPTHAWKTFSNRYEHDGSDQKCRRQNQHEMKRSSVKQVLINRVGLLPFQILYALTLATQKLNRARQQLALTGMLLMELMRRVRDKHRRPFQDSYP